jgi:hypothetical protein
MVSKELKERERERERRWNWLMSCGEKGRWDWLMSCGGLGGTIKPMGGAKSVMDTSKSVHTTISTFWRFPLF